MSTDLARRLDAAATPGAAERPASVVDLIRRMEPEIARALPRHLSAERMTRLALTELRRNPALARASAESLLGALMWAAQLGLEPGPLGHVYLLPRTPRGAKVPEVVFVLGYRGVAELAYRSGLVTEIHAAVVWRGEEFDYEAGDDERIRHVPRLDLDPSPADFVCAYAVATATSGARFRAVVKPRDVKRARAASAAGDKGPWATDFEAMARKTAIRRLAALLPQSAELNGALQLDETVVPPLRAGRPIPALEEAQPIRPEPEREPTPEPEPTPDELAGAMQRALDALAVPDLHDLRGLLLDANVIARVDELTGQALARTYPQVEPTVRGLKRLRDDLAEAAAGT